MIKITFQY